MQRKRAEAVAGMEKTKHQGKKPAIVKEVYCEVCGVKLSEHPYCRICTILVGPGHVETTLANGLCKSCYHVSRFGKLQLPKRVRQRAKVAVASG